MASSWEDMGDIGTIAQLVGVDAVKLIKMIVQAANTARLHKKNCRQFAQHLKLIGNLLEQLQISELKKYPEIREPMEQLEHALRKSYVLVNSCQDRSYLYLLAMGWNIVQQFKKAQTEIDNYLRIVPLITLLDNLRLKEKLENIEKNQCEYTLEEEDREIQDAILSCEPSKTDMAMLKRSLSCSYPNLSLENALRRENKKLHQELQASQSRLDPDLHKIIHHLIEVTNTMANSLPKNIENAEKTEEKCSEISGIRFDHKQNEWHSDLLDCCSEPYLCIKTFCLPCATLAKISSVAKNREISSAQICNSMIGYSLIFSCCCYTCCIRRKLRRVMNIKGGFLNDFFSHLICCCCALVQEWREVKARGVGSELLGLRPIFIIHSFFQAPKLLRYGFVKYLAKDKKIRASPPTTQHMDPS